MIKTLLAVLLLSLMVVACDSSSSTESNSPANRSANSAASASPNTSATEQASPAPPTGTPQFKAGDKVKVKSNGSSSEATVVSVDEKSGKVTVKLSRGEEKTVAISDVTKQ